MTLIAHLPHYVRLEEDYQGRLALLQLLSSLYGLDMDLSSIQQVAEEQYRRITQAVEADNSVKEIVESLEASYDEGADVESSPDRPPRLSPEVEKFLTEMEQRFNADN